MSLSATFIKSWRNSVGSSSLYRLSEPIYNPNDDRPWYYVLVFSRNGVTGSQFFPADSYGEVSVWFDYPIPDSSNGVHASALEEAGYTVC